MVLHYTELHCATMVINVHHAHIVCAAVSCGGNNINWVYLVGKLSQVVIFVSQDSDDDGGEIDDDEDDDDDEDEDDGNVTCD